MAPYGDELEKTSETKLGLEQAVRERAYLLWEKDGCPEGRAEEYWHRALDEHFGSGPTFCGSKKEVPKGAKMNIGVSLSISRLSDSAVPRTSSRRTEKTTEEATWRRFFWGAGVEFDARANASEQCSTACKKFGRALLKSFGLPIFASEAPAASRGVFR